MFLLQSLVPGIIGPLAAGAATAFTAARTRSATPGSTSYDAADEEPFEPGWTGATWYGASSGTYWTLNPKEYADPRKHGPEYQRRARRRAAGANADGAAPLADEPWVEDSAEHVDSPFPGAPDEASSSGDSASADWAARRPPPGRRGEPVNPAGEPPARAVRI